MFSQYTAEGFSYNAISRVPEELYHYSTPGKQRPASRSHIRLPQQAATTGASRNARTAHTSIQLAPPQPGGVLWCVRAQGGGVLLVRQPH